MSCLSFNPWYKASFIKNINIYKVVMVYNQVYKKYFKTLYARWETLKMRNLFQSTTCMWTRYGLFIFIHYSGRIIFVYCTYVVWLCDLKNKICHILHKSILFRNENPIQGSWQAKSPIFYKLLTLIDTQEINFKSKCSLGYVLIKR